MRRCRGLALTAGLLWATAVFAAPPAEVRLVAVTLDDLPLATGLFRDPDERAAITRRLLDALLGHDVPAVGFVNEGKLYVEGVLDPRQVALLRAWTAAGLELGNHTYSHPSLNRLPLDPFLEEVVRGERVTRQLATDAGRPLRYFRHPFLHTGRSLETKHALERFLRERSYRVAPVTIDNSEWVFARAYERAIEQNDEHQRALVAETYVPYLERYFGFYERQSRALFGREIPQILLLHANALNADTFDTLARMIEQRGYRFVSLERALEDEAYVSPDEYVGPGGISWIHRWALTAGKHGEFFHGEPRVPDWVRELSGLER